MKKEEMINILKKSREHENDTGSTAVQVVHLTKRIDEMNEHFKVHGGDNSSRRGLMVLVGRRKSLLAYLKRKSFLAYKEIINSIGLRK